MSRSLQHPWLNRFAWLTAAATLVLIAVGGLVTSKGAGMAVPDWPTTYGYNMFLFPFHLWGRGTGVFYEHSHRLFASFVGFLTSILAVWLWLREPRRWLRWMGVAAWFAVVLQGILGGLRVTLLKDELGIFHAALAQSFLVLLTVIALCASRADVRLIEAVQAAVPSLSVRRLVLITTGIIFIQLILGATMRHQHAGLAVPDFPLAYGQIWPPTDAAFVEKVNQQRLGIQDYQPITAFQIGLHMTHRLVALLIVCCVAAITWAGWRPENRAPAWRRLTAIWSGLILAQALLGAATVWTNKAADVATAHVVLGAASLVWGSLLSFGLLRCARVEAWAGGARSVLNAITPEPIRHPRKSTA